MGQGSPIGPNMSGAASAPALPGGGGAAPFDLGGFLAGLVPGMSLLSSGVNIASSIGNWITGNSLAEKNFRLQQGQFDWMKAMQGEAWRREDTAVQRRVADLKAAGLSPVLAAGSGASSSSPVSINAPQRAFVPYENNFNGLGELAAIQNIATAGAQQKYIEAQIAKLLQDKAFEAHDANILMKNGLLIKGSAENLQATEQMNQLFKAFGLDANMGTGPLMNIIKGLGPVVIKLLTEMVKIKK